MLTNQLAIRYAKAIYEIAVENSVLKEIGAQLEAGDARLQRGHSGGEALFEDKQGQWRREQIQGGVQAQGRVALRDPAKEP